MLKETELVEKLKNRPRLPGPVWVYSSLIGDWTDSPLGLVVGLDDHGFHRGDGVFEALRVIDRKPYLLEPHFQRMRKSAEKIGIAVPFDFKQLSELLQKGLQSYPESNGLLRLFLTRGAGGFSTNPQECLAPNFFAVIGPFAPPKEERYAAGVSVGKSIIPMKPPWMATTKSLNYLPNVMMKQEAIQRGLDFTVSFDDRGVLGESSTENMIVLTRRGELAYPPLTQVLRGCTMLRLFALVEEVNLLPVKREALIKESDLLEAQGLYMVGTTLDVIPVSKYEGHEVPLSPWGPKLRALIREDQRSL